MENEKHFERIKKGFGSFSDSYDTGVALGGLSEESRIRKESIKFLNLENGAVVFDICCGTGLNFKILENQIGDHGRIVGVDLTAEMLDIAKRRCEKNKWKNIDLINANILEFNTDKLGDYAICTAAMGMIPEYAEAIDLIIEKLKPNGSFAIVDVKANHRFPYKIFNYPFYLFGKSAGFDIKTRDLISYIKSKYEVEYYKEYFGGFCYTIVFKKH